MSSNCKIITCPDGIWKADNMIGAHVKIVSMAACNFSKFQDADKMFTISDVLFRTTLDGKTTTIIRIKEHPELTLTWKDLEVVNVIDF